MTTMPAATTSTDSATEHVDVLIVGAGISGIGAAFHLQDELPRKSYAILEARNDLGGTWDLFRYPGIRSDSDLHTFGYRFKPWTGEKSIADGPSIKAYLREAAEENGIDRQIRYGHRVVRAEWSSETALWTASVESVHTGETFEMTASWLFCASGYYRYDRGFMPDFEGIDDFAGQVVHPQHWPEDLDCAGKRVVVIGSGATAVTLVPALAEQAAAVTMLQRSPTYVMPVPDRDGLADRLRRMVGEELAYRITRRKNIARQRAFYGLCRRYPKQARRFIRWVNSKQLEGSGVDVDVHFKPKYDPWDQRVCAVPNGDLYRALHRGTATVVTDRIERFTEHGILLASGKELEADVVVAATGLNLLVFGGIELTVDGQEVSLPDRIAYKGSMLSGVPNFVFAIGYTNSSWTLKVDLVCEYLCRLMAHVDERGFDAAVPEVSDPAMGLLPLLDFEAGYVKRSLDQLPKQGADAPWHLTMNYAKDARNLRRGSMDDDAMRFFAATGRTSRERATVPA